MNGEIRPNIYACLSLSIVSIYLPIYPATYPLSILIIHRLPVFEYVYLLKVICNLQINTQYVHGYS